MKPKRKKLSLTVFHVELPVQLRDRTHTCLHGGGSWYNCRSVSGMQGKHTHTHIYKILNSF